MVITREIRDEIKSSVTVSSGIRSALKDDDFMKIIVNRVTDNILKTLGERISQLEQKIEKSFVNNLKKESAMLKSENDSLLKKVDVMDQENRLNSLRIFNSIEMPSEKKEEIIHTMIHSHLGITMKNDDILDCRRIGRKQVAKLRGVTLKLAIYVYNKKKTLKGSRIIIIDYISEGRVKVMEYTIEKTSLKDLWSYMGDIYVTKDNKNIIVKSKVDVEYI
nr:unnamed protein product [Callosobruchus chinensis]